MYRFKSKADGDLLMMEPVGDQILRILGREPASQGILSVDALPAAIAALQQAIAEAEPKRAGHDDAEAEGGAVAVGLAQRAWPMLEMMRRSLAERADIVWGV
jgi:uncharacterized protein DUF1840